MTPRFLRELKAGEPEAFAEVVRIFTPRLRRMAMSFFHSPFEQEEAVQEAFLRLFKQLKAIDSSRADKLEGFITTLARRRFIDLRRARQGEELVVADPPEPGSAAPDEEVEARELEQLMSRFEEKLKPPFRRYFRAVFVHGHDEETARIALEMPPLRARYVKKVLVSKLRRHGPLLERLQRRRGEKR